MATSFASSPLSALHSPSRQQFLTPNSPPQNHRHLVSRQRFIYDFSQCLYEFVVQLLPTAEEMAVKEDVRKLLERLIRTIEPDSRLLSFGSSANGFSLKNSDMDLCCLIDSGERLNASDLVAMVGDLLQRETKFHVKPLPHARIPIVKLNLDSSPALPFGIACDIGFENRLALENTRLLMCYASIDPARVRTMVLFLKVWSKRRKINSPYKGTLSSYGYVLLVIYFLVHVKNPPVLPNLQQMPPLRPISEDESHLNGYNIWFFDDIELLRERWKSSNTDTVADLLIDFFRYYSRDFAYGLGVASIRAGLLRKEDKGWACEQADYGTTRERNRLCIEDPFETDFNVARCVTKDGLYTIRGEFMRASRILQFRPERAILALAELCEERKDETLGPPPPQSRSAFAPPRLTSIPPQTPYTVGSSPMRPKGVPILAPEDFAPLQKFSHALSPVSPTPSSPSDSPGRVIDGGKDLPLRLPVNKLDHMAPIRSKWTSPPPAEAPEEVRSTFEDRLDRGLTLATTTNAPRMREHSYASSNNSEVQTDDDRQSIADSDDLRSVKSFVEDGAVDYAREFRERERQLASLHAQQQALQLRLQQQFGVDPSNPSSHDSVALPSRLEGGVDVKMISRLRGRPVARVAPQANSKPGAAGGRMTPGDRNDGFTPPPRMDTHTPRRSMSFPTRNVNRFSLPAMGVMPNHLAMYPTPLSPSLGHTAPRYVLQAAAEAQARANVYYETMPSRECMFRAMASHSPQMQLSSPESYDRVGSSQSRSRSRSMSRSPPPSDSRILIRRGTFTEGEEELVAGPSRLPTLALASHQNSGRIERTHSHQHSHSNTTITAPTPPPNTSHFVLPATLPAPPQSVSILGPRQSPHSRSRSPPPYLPTQRNLPHPYPFQSGFPSPRLGMNLPPRLRADRERQASQVGMTVHLGSPGISDARPLMAQVDAPHIESNSPLPPHTHIRSSSPSASHSFSSSGSASPPMSSTSSQYAVSSSPLSTSPPSPAESTKKAGGEADRYGVVSPLQSLIPLLDQAVSVPLSLQPELEEKEKGAATPIPVTCAAPATSMVAFLEQKTEPNDAVAAMEPKTEASSTEPLASEVLTSPESGDYPRDEMRQPLLAQTPEVLVLEISPIAERSSQAVKEAPLPGETLTATDSVAGP